MNNINFVAIPPGEMIREEMNGKLISLKKFGAQMDMSEKQVNNLLRGKIEIDKGIALKLQNTLGVPKEFWLNIEMQYRRELNQFSK